MSQFAKKMLFYAVLVISVALATGNALAKAKTCPKYGYCNIIKKECLSGQCVAYCRSKTGFSGKVAIAKNWPTNSSKPVKGGVVVLNIGSFGHVAYIDSVNEKNKTFTVRQYNFGSKLICAECYVTDKYGVETPGSYSFGDKRIIGYWKK